MRLCIDIGGWRTAATHEHDMKVKNITILLFLILQLVSYIDGDITIFQKSALKKQRKKMDHTLITSSTWTLREVILAKLENYKELELLLERSKNQTVV